MKKILNDPFAYAEETLRGLVRAYPQYYRLVEGTNRVIARAEGPLEGKVGIVTGGGSGHLPVFTGYVGPGLLDACACGDVFASPSVDAAGPIFQAPAGQKDDLKLISGVGPVMESRLNAAGITTWAQLAEMSSDDVAKLESHLSFPGRVARDQWIKQAEALARGGAEEYRRVFGKDPR